LPAFNRHKALGNGVDTEEEAFQCDGSDAGRCPFRAEQNVSGALKTIDFDEHMAQLLFMAPAISQPQSNDPVRTDTEF
jgi:hypothetical protein